MKLLLKKTGITLQLKLYTGTCFRTKIKGDDQLNTLNAYFLFFIEQLIYKN